MTKKSRQYLSILVAMICYYIIHEGAHFLYALTHGVFKNINFMILGVQIDVFRDQLGDSQLGWFCLAGPIATLIAGYVLVLLRKKICAVKSPLLKACGWYTSMAMLMLDPLYLTVINRIVGGGDMNGIKLLIPENIVMTIAGVLLVVNLIVLMKIQYPVFTEAFRDVKN